jgi:hypothetical protein
MNLQCPPTACSLRVAIIGISASPAGSLGKILDQIREDGYLVNDTRNPSGNQDHPDVFTAAADPVQIGLVASLNRPGGNVTGVNSMNGELDPNRLTAHFCASIRHQSETAFALFLICDSLLC